MNNIAIITARGGSKRIPRKNIKNFFGKPIIAYSIECAIKSNLFSEVMVSTDDEEIAKISKQYGASVPFMRSAKNSDDFSGTADVLLEVLKEYQKRNIEFDYACCIYPTAPLIQVSKIEEAYNVLQDKNADTVFPVAKFNYPIQRSYEINNGQAFIVDPKNYYSRSQDLPERYFDSGSFYWFNPIRFLEKNQLITDNTFVIELSELEVQDIDNLIDWQLAELKYQVLHNANRS